MIYCDELLGEAFIGNSFVSEPVHNLVHREIVERDGVTFKSHKPADEENTEFLASEDTWFRPTTIRTGPDGALWVADMYREIIEHPQWVSDDLKPTVDSRSGNDRGRIYRIYPAGAKPRAVPRLDKLNAGELAALLESPSATLRDMAQIQIVTRDLKDAVAPLEKLARESKRPAARLQALCALDGLGGASLDLLKHALTDENPWVRREAVRLLETRAEGAEVLDIEVIKTEKYPAVRLQLACSLGEFKSGSAGGAALAEIARRDRDNPFIIAAVLSSLHERNIRTFAEAWLASPANQSPHSDEALAGLIETALDGKHTLLVEMLVGQFAEPNADSAYAPWQLSGLAVVYPHIATSGKPLSEKLDFSRDGEGSVRQLVDNAAAFARRTLDSEDSALPLRLASIHLIATVADKNDADWQSLTAQLQPTKTGQVQSAAVTALSQNARPRVPQVLLHDWKSHGPQLRSQILDVLLSRGQWTQTLLASIDKGDVSPADIDAVRRQRLLKSGDKAIRAKAVKLLAGGSDPDRAKVVARYQPLLASLAESDVIRGKAIFAKRCAACHRVDNVGNEVGPDLAGLTDKSPPNLLASILDPNRAVEPKFVSYTAIMQDGRLLAGMLADESGGSLTLLDAEGKRHTLLRRDLDELKASGKSLMPEGLEQDITPDDMRDLLTYLQRALSAK